MRNDLWLAAERLATGGLELKAGAIYARLLIAAELNVGPAAALGSISITKGKPAIAAALQSALVQRSGRWRYEVVECNDEAAELAWFDGDRQVGESTYTIEQAKRAGLLKKDVWQQYPGDLLFARAMTRGIRRYCPSVLAGMPSYTREELGENVHEPARPKATDEQLALIKQLKDDLRIDADSWAAILAKRNVKSARDLSPEEADKLVIALRHRAEVADLEEGLREGGDAPDATGKS